jgi:putative acetyltransferase
MRIRDFRIGDETALHAVFHSAVHQLASQHYTADQINAWAPDAVDQDIWAERMRGIRPFVLEHAGQIIAYADIQSSGYIDHFYVAGTHARRGIGTMLMNRIHQTANMQGIKVLTSDVSRTAQPFFHRFGFVVVEQRSPVIRGVVVPNALMRKQLLAASL